MARREESLLRIGFEELRLPERTKRFLLHELGSPREVFEAGARALRDRGLPAETARIIRDFRFDAVDKRWQQLKTAGCRCTWPGGTGYPTLLAEIADPPRLLMIRGELDPEEECVAVVGSRRASSYGLDVAEYLGRELAGHGLTVVSGLARGIDAAAHGAALAKGGRTVAVLGCGLDIVYPREHARLYEEIAASGALLAEFPPGTPPRSRNFPRRNRIISGLCRAVIVVEGRERSGSQITARLANEQNREVLAVPHDLQAPAGGGEVPNRLVSEGWARLLRTVDDVLDELPLGAREALREQARRRGIQPVPESANEPGSGRERLLHALSRREKKTPDELSAEAGVTSSEALQILTLLELEGVVRKLPGLRYVLRTDI